MVSGKSTSAWDPTTTACSSFSTPAVASSCENGRFSKRPVRVFPRPPSIANTSRGERGLPLPESPCVSSAIRAPVASPGRDPLRY